MKNSNKSIQEAALQQTRKKTSSIKHKVIRILITVVVCVTLLSGGSSVYLNYTSSVGVLSQSMAETATVAADKISQVISIYKNVAFELGCISRLSDSALSVAEKQTIVDGRVESYDLQRGNVLKPNGDSLFDGNNYADRDYFQQALKGKTTVSDPIVSKVTGALTYIFAAPLWEGGQPNTTVVGVVYIVPDENFLNNAMGAISIGQSGSAYMLNNVGLTIASIDTNAVGSENTIELAKTDKSFQTIADQEQKMVNLESGFGTYTYNGVTKASAYAPVPNTNGWSIAITVKIDEFLGGMQQSLVITIIMAVLFIVICVILATRFGAKIVRPIRLCSERLALLSKGDLTTEVPKSETTDESGLLLDDLGNTVDGLRGVVADIKYQLGEMAEGNLTEHMTRAYAGDFVEIQDSLHKIQDSFREAMQQITESSQQVSAGAEQVSSGAQALSQGATEQASAVEELAASINEISANVRTNAEHAQSANRHANRVGEKLEESNQQMAQAIQAMGEISRYSQDIGKIIKTIEDIASQTNILALNAAVEAARAGAAGKGFAVVAEEVRNLASKSAESSKNTAELIESSVRAVSNGTHLVTATAQSLDEAVKGSKEIVESVENISRVSSDQATSIQQVSQGVDQISAVVQTNSATAEESAAASEELSGQSSMLRDLVSHFRI